jgi:PAS domain S-box-containing protein
MNRLAVIEGASLTQVQKQSIRLGAFGIGMLSLCLFSVIQKIFIREPALIFNPRAYVVPALYGGLTGFLLSEWYLKLKQNTLLLQNSQEQLRMLIDALPDFIIFKDGEGRWLDVNNVGEKLFRISTRQYYGLTDLQLAEQLSDFRELLTRCYRTDEDTWTQQRLTRCLINDFPAQDRFLNYELVKVPIFYPDGKRKGMVTIGRDITTLVESEQRILQAYDSTLEGWAMAIELRDKTTDNHSQRVVQMTERLAQILGVPEEEMIQIRRGALLHDIGKISIPDSILCKPGPLTNEETNVMRRHPEYAYRMMCHIEFLRPALDIPYCHHEYWNGSGYPRGLKCDEIPFAARIFSVVDVWDALTSDRPYRKAWTREKALDYIQSLSGTQFDPQVVKTFIDSKIYA